MMSHQEGPDCPSCDEKLTQAHWYMSMWFQWIKSKYPNVHVAWSFRSQEDQNAAFQQGTSKLKWPQSKHNTLDDKGFPYASALDIFQIIDGKAIFDAHFYEQVYVLTIGRSFQLTWGGQWENFPDRDHWELIDNFNAMDS